MEDSLKEVIVSFSFPVLLIFGSLCSLLTVVVE